MFYARKNELQLMNELYISDKFEFLILYGRRRVGKTALLSEFAKDKKAIFFSAQEKNDMLNLTDFSKAVQNHFDGNYYTPFRDWASALAYVGDKTTDTKTLLIIDEFPFIASENPSVKSILQHTIDHIWKEKNIFLILCGSSISFMEKEVMGYKSPLYGRSTAQLEVKPFDYLDSAEFFPNYSNTDKLISYGILGGIPCYLEAFDDTYTIAQNLAKNVLRTGAFLKEEPQVLLRMELREPSVYNSIFEAIAGGASRINDISGAIHEEMQKCSKYMTILRSIKLVDKLTPAGDDESSRKTFYRIYDNYFLFWFRYLFTNRSYYEIIGPENAAKEITKTENMSNYMGLVFEQICQQYLIRKAKAGKLPFAPHVIGKWWGNNPAKKTQDDIDILVLGEKRKKAIFCECKFRNTPFDKAEYEDLLSASEIFTDVTEKYYMLFSKGGFTKWVEEQAKQSGNITLVEIDDLFDILKNVF